MSQIKADQGTQHVPGQCLCLLQSGSHDVLFNKHGMAQPGHINVINNALMQKAKALFTMKDFAEPHLMAAKHQCIALADSSMVRVWRIEEGTTKWSQVWEYDHDCVSLSLGDRELFWITANQM